MSRRWIRRLGAAFAILAGMAVIRVAPLVPGGLTQAHTGQPRSAAELHRDMFVMDAHTHMINRQLHLGGDITDRYQDGQVDVPRMREGGVNAIFLSLSTSEAFYDYRYELKATLRLVELCLQQLEEHRDQIELALTASGIERITGEGKIAAFMDLEGSFDLDGDLLALQALYRLGMRSLMLPGHNQNSNFADSCCDAPQWGGINERGRQVIREMNRLGMVINVAHSATETILQTVEASTDPVLYSHGGYRHFVNVPRNISDEAARAIASKGGVLALQIGNSMNNPRDFEWLQEQARLKDMRPSFMLVPETPKRLGERPPFVEFEELERRMASRHPNTSRDIPPEIRMTVDELVEVIDYAVRLVGEDHVAIGSDFDGSVPPPHGVHDISDYAKITEGLVRKGYPEGRIRKIMGLNLLRLIREVTEK